MCCAPNEGDVVRTAGLVGRRGVESLWVSSIILVVFAGEVRTICTQGACHVIVLERLGRGGIERAAEREGPRHLHVGGADGDVGGKDRQENGTEGSHVVYRGTSVVVD
jgi:hypothetical protein